MIITKTPFRISFCGGGTDLPGFYKKNNGQVLTASIKNYMYVLVKKQTGIIEYKYKIHWSKTEFKNKISEINHPIVREALRYFKINYPIEISSFADIPASTGLGSSSSFAVGLVKALFVLSGKNKSNEHVAKIASKIEVDILKRKIGRQDHYSTCYGNLNLIDFFKNDKVKVRRIKMSNNNKKILETSCILLYTKLKRDANDVLKKQHKPSKTQFKNLVNLKLDVIKFKKNFTNKKFNIREIGKLLNKQWELKKKINNISNTKIDKMYNEAMFLGAYGGKLLGAGSGGFLLILSNKRIQEKLKKKFGEQNIINIKFDNDGNKIIYKKNNKV